MPPGAQQPAASTSRPRTRMRLTSHRSKHVPLENAARRPCPVERPPSFGHVSKRRRPAPAAPSGPRAHPARRARPPRRRAPLRPPARSSPARRRGAGTRSRRTCRLRRAHPLGLAGGQARPLPPDEGGEGPGLSRRDVAAQPLAAAGRVDPAGLARPEGAGLAAAAAGLPGRLRAAGGDGRAEGQLLLGAGGAVHGLQGHPGGEAGAQERRQQQGRQPAAAQQRPQATHVADEEGARGGKLSRLRSRRQFTYIQLERAIYTVLCLAINL